MHFIFLSILLCAQGRTEVVRVAILILFLLPALPAATVMCHIAEPWRWRVWGGMKLVPKGVFCNTQLSGFSGWIFRTPVQLTKKRCFFQGCPSPLRSPRKGRWIVGRIQTFLGSLTIKPINSANSTTISHICSSFRSISFMSWGGRSWILLLRHHQRVKECVHMAELLCHTVWSHVLGGQLKKPSQLPLIYLYRNCQAVYREIPSPCR